MGNPHGTHEKCPWPMEAGTTRREVISCPVCYYLLYQDICAYIKGVSLAAVSTTAFVANLYIESSDPKHFKQP